MSELGNYNTTINELALKLHYHPNYLRHLAAMGKIPAIKRCRMWMFDENEVFKYLQAETEKNVGGDSSISSLV